MDKNSSKNASSGIKTTLIKTSDRRDNVRKTEIKKIKVKLRGSQSRQTGTEFSSTKKNQAQVIDSAPAKNSTDISKLDTKQKPSASFRSSSKTQETTNNRQDDTADKKLDSSRSEAKKNSTTAKPHTATKTPDLTQSPKRNQNLQSKAGADDNKTTSGGGQRSLLVSQLQKIRNTAKLQKAKIQSTTNTDSPKPRTSRPTEGMSSGAPPSTGAPSRRSFKATRRRPAAIVQRREPLEKQLFFKSKKSQASSTNSIPKSINVTENISIADLAKKMNIKASLLLSKLMSMGTMVTLNSVIDSETASILAAEYDCTLHVVSLYDQTIIEKPTADGDDLIRRGPVVSIMGHVDHGKTQLLDTIRNTNVVAAEHGKITQHIGAYQVNIDDIKDLKKSASKSKSKDKSQDAKSINNMITFLDTPGHAAFSMMRARGAKVTDLVLLVVAANDGIKEQTIEAISHIKEAAVPMIVVINKVDIIEPDITSLYTQLTEHGVSPEEWGGDVMVCKVSALTGLGIPELFESIKLQSELLDLKASESIPAYGTVLESKIEKGRGIVATLLIEDGILRKGDFLLTGIYASKVRTMYDDTGKELKLAGPSTPVEITGLEGLPKAGDPFQVTENDKIAKTIASKRQELSRTQDASLSNKITSDNLLMSIESDRMTEYKIIVKADMQGSAEAIKHSLEELSNDYIRIKVIQATAGNINESDVMLASASEADIIGFNVAPTQKIQALTDREKVMLKKYSVIFEVIDDVKKKILDLKEPEYEDIKMAEVEVREVFVIPKKGKVLGAYIRSGSVEKGYFARRTKDGQDVDLGTVITLQRFKDTVNKVESGFECGIGLSEGDDIQKGDELTIYTKQEIITS